MKIFLSNHVLFSLFSVFFILLHAGGYVFSALMEGYGISKVYAGGFFSYILPWFFYVFFAMFYFFIYRVIRVGNADIDNEIFYKKYAFIIFSAAFLIYFSKQGLVIFKDGGYENRYEANQGLGVVSQLLIFFYFGFSIWVKQVFMKNLDGPVSVRSYKEILIVALLFAFSTFVLLGGHRQLGFGVVFLLMYVFYQSNIIKLHQVIIGAIAALVLVTLVAVYRYENLDVSERGVMFYLVIFLFDGLTPVNAYYDIYNDIVQYGSAGFNVALDQLMYIIPRFIWEDKPEIIINGGNYYTQFILGRKSLVTYSPTLLGELMIVHGVVGALLLAPLVSLFVAIYDKICATHSSIGFILISLAPLIAFNLYREGFYVVLTKMTLTSLFLFLFILSGKFILPVIYQRIKIRI